jgi:hypothetical protein
MMKKVTKTRSRTKKPKDGVKVRGFFHVQLVEKDDEGMPKVVGDSGWCENTVVNLGFRDYLCRLLAASAGSLQVSRMCIGTGTGPGLADTSLDGELNTATYSRTTLTLSQGGSTAMSFLATFASANSHITATTNIRNIALINDTASAGTIFAGSTYASSQWNTNQDLNATYAITFA